MARYSLPLKIFEQPHRYPTLEQAEANKVLKQIPPKDMVIDGRNVDEVKKKARAFLEKDGRIVRSVSIGPHGISAVVYSAEEKKDPRTDKASRRRY